MIECTTAEMCAQIASQQEAMLVDLVTASVPLTLLFVGLVELLYR